MKNCKKCNSTNIVVEPWTKILSPNVYKLYDKIICRDCRSLEIVDLEEVDKNTENTRKLLTGNYFVDKNGDVVPKSSKKIDLKDYAKKAQEQINIEELFN